MAEPMQNVQPIKQTLKARQCFLKGRIEGSRSNPKGGFFVQIRCPAEDEYSMPALLDVSSKQRLGAIGDDWSGIVQVSGSPNSYKDRQTGDVINTANHYLRVVE